MLSGRAICGLKKQLLNLISNLCIMDLDKYESRSIEFILRKKKNSSVLFTAFDWKHCVTIMICCTILFLIQLFPENKSSISILDSTTKNSDWSSAFRQSHLSTLKKSALFKFQFVYYGSWQIWKPLNSVQTSKIKKIPAYSLLPSAENIAWQLWFAVYLASYSTLPWNLRAHF